MSNILNNNRNLIDFVLADEDYWDFQLSEELGYGKFEKGLTTECLSAYIDFNDPNCIEWDDIISKENFIWANAINEGVTLKKIGVTGVDNGFISYQKDRITNKEFLKIFLESVYDTSKDGLNFRMRKVNGNNQLYDYSNNLIKLGDKEVSELNGGFYQGYFKIPEKRYQTLPYIIENGWTLETRLQKKSIINNGLTINETHTENKGMFLYIGTRAENKWWEKYLVNNGYEEKSLDYTDHDYLEEGYTTENSDENTTFMTPYEESDYISLIYGNEEFIEKDVKINGDEELYNEDGIEFSQPNMIKYDTDNKFLLFNRTEDGFTIKNWDEQNKVTIYDIKKPTLENYHTLFNHTQNGYTIKNIQDLINKENKRYSILKDLYQNALGFQIKDDGSIGFKYLVKDCESEDENYKIISLFSKEGLIKEDEWYTISIKIVNTTYSEISNPTCDTYHTSNKPKMIIYIYVNGMLKLKSDELPMLNLKALNDLSDKQEGVPFSLSLGGGTQGLCDVVNLGYRHLPKYILPLEKEFCGSFIGYIQSFRFYDCPLNITKIKENYNFDTNL